MNEPFRDPLDAALYRVHVLEQENNILKRGITPIPIIARVFNESVFREFIKILYGRTKKNVSVAAHAFKVISIICAVGCCAATLFVNLCCYTIIINRTRDRVCQAFPVWTALVVIGIGSVLGFGWYLISVWQDAKKAVSIT